MVIVVSFLIFVKLFFYLFLLNYLSNVIDNCQVKMFGYRWLINVGIQNIRYYFTVARVTSYPKDATVIRKSII